MKRNTLLIIILLSAIWTTGCGQRTTKEPAVTSIAGLPSEPLPPATCKASGFGYVGMPDEPNRTELTNEELGAYIHSQLKEGYILTVFPKTKRGIFVNAQCK